jgi:hypothetical protein
MALRWKVRRGASQPSPAAPRKGKPRDGRRGGQIVMGVVQQEWGAVRGASVSLEKPLLKGIAHQIGGLFDIQFRHDISPVMLHRPVADAE